MRGFTLDDISRWMAAAPAALAGFSHRAGALAPGHDASFVVFDPDASFKPAVNDLHTRHAISPYIGESLKGRVEATYLRGAPVYRREAENISAKFASRPAGEEMRSEVS